MFNSNIRISLKLGLSFLVLAAGVIFAQNSKAEGCDCGGGQKCGGCFPFSGGDPCDTWAPGSSCDGSCCVYTTSYCWELMGWSSECPGSENYCTYMSYYNACGTCWGTKNCDKPLYVNGSCDSGGTISLSFDGGYTTTRYYDVRIDETSNNGLPGEIDGWYLSNPPDLILNWYLGNSYTYQGIPGKYYNVWVHPSGTNIKASTGFTCPLPTCNLPWGGTINSGQSATAYSTASVACGGSCSSETRNCTNGVLSGSYTVSSCSAAACPLATASVSVSPNPMAYGGSPNFTLSSTNAYYCHVLMDGVWDWNASGYFTSGTYSPGALTSSGVHSAWAYCYNRDWIGSGWSTTNFTVLPAPTATLSASPTSIPYNGSSTLSWSTTDATSCWADWSGWVAVNGSVSTGALTANRTYNLTCYNSAGYSPGTKSVLVSVVANPTLSFSGAPLNVTSGTTSTLTWSTTNATSCWGSSSDGSWNGWKAVSSSVSTGALTASRTYGLTCYNSVGVSTGTQNVSISVVPVPMLTFSASPTFIASSGASALTWVTTGATSCWGSSLDGSWNGWKTNTGGTVSTGILNTQQTYSLTCYNSIGVATATQNVTISIPALPTISFSAIPDSITPNSPFALTWSTTGATSCTSDWAGGVSVNGSTSINNLGSSKTYNLTCSNSVGASVSQSASVFVCSPSHTCSNFDCTGFCGPNHKNICVPVCGYDCAANNNGNCGVTSCPACNSGGWREIAQ